MEMMLIYVCLGVFTVLVVVLLTPKQETSVIERVQRVKDAVAQGKTGSMVRDQEHMQKSFVERVMLPLADRMSTTFSGITPVGMIQSNRINIQRAGLAGKVSPTQLATLSWILMIVCPLVALLYVFADPALETWKKYGAVLLAAVIGYRMPIGIVQGKAKKRMHEIQKSLAFTLDLISISVEAGMAFDGAMSIVAEKTKGPLTDELNLTLNEIRLGKGRNEALQDMAGRVGVEDLRNFLTAVVYISRLGGSLVDVIRIQASAMRIKRRQRAEEKAMKTPVKIMIPLVLFIFPAMFIVILGPAAISLMSSGDDFNKSTAKK
jgi:tight adherence protein C